MPNFTVVKGRIARHGVIYEEDDRITLDDEAAAPLLASGQIEPLKRGRQPAAKSRKSWTPDDDATDADTGAEAETEDEGGEG